MAQGSNGEGQKPPRSMFDRVIAIATLVVALALGVGQIAQSQHWWPFEGPTAAQLATDYDGHDPSDSCVLSPKDRTITHSEVLAVGSANVEVDVRHATACAASYVWVNSHVPGAAVIKTLWRSAGNGLDANSVVSKDTAPATQSAQGFKSYSLMLYAPDCRALKFQVILRDSQGKKLADTGIKPACN